MEHRLDLLVEGARVGDYALVRRLGLGGFGQVWLAHRAERAPEGVNLPARPQRRVALKILAGVGGPIDLVSEWFQGRQVDHPNVVRILDMGRDGELWFMAMEFIDGLNFRQLGREVQRLGGHVPLDAVVELGLQASRGLGAVHEATDLEGRPLQMIHRDVKPDNVMLDRHGIVRLVDFGIAKGADALAQTQINMAKGSPLWMAPEQHYADHITPAADLFSLATVLYELRVGKTLFAAPTLEQLAQIKRGKHARERVREHADSLGALAPILEECLQANPDRRPASARDLEDELARLLESFPRGPSLRELYDMVTDERIPRTETLSEEWATLAISLMGPRFPDPELMEAAEQEPQGRAPVVPARPVPRLSPAPLPPPAPPSRPPALPPVQPIEERELTTDEVRETWLDAPRVTPDSGSIRRTPGSAAATPARLPAEPRAVPRPVVPAARRPLAPPLRVRWLLGAVALAGLALAAWTLTGGNTGRAEEDGPVPAVEQAPAPAPPPEGPSEPVAEDVDGVAEVLVQGSGERCNGVDDDHDGLVWTWEQDRDGDGYARCVWDEAMPAGADTGAMVGTPRRGGDCDDSDRRKHPGAREVAGDPDLNCDGQLPGLADLDGDGFPVGDDCNDEDASVHRGAVEIVANHIDENCDGLEMCYTDRDNDGFGLSDQLRTDATLRCAGMGLASESGDCDDSNDTVYVGAPERCGDRLDNNCNGKVDLDDPACRPPANASMVKSATQGEVLETTWSVPGGQACDRILLTYTVRGRMLGTAPGVVALQPGREGSAAVYRGNLDVAGLTPQSLDWTLTCEQGTQRSHIAGATGAGL